MWPSFVWWIAHKKKLNQASPSKIVLLGTGQQTNWDTLDLSNRDAAALRRMPICKIASIRYRLLLPVKSITIRNLALTMQAEWNIDLVDGQFTCCYRISHWWDVLFAIRSMGFWLYAKLCIWQSFYRSYCCASCAHI